MTTSCTLSLALILVAGPPASAIAQVRSQAAGTAAPRTVATQPIGVRLMTVVDHGATLAGSYVQLPAARATRVVGPRLLLIGNARERGNYGGYRANRWDSLLVLLPPGVSVRRGDVLTGTVRTVHGARLSGELAGVSDDSLKRYSNATLLVAERVQTADGVSLVGR